MKKTQPSVAAIVVGYNSKEYLKECFDSLLAGTITPRLYFLDNASTDGSAAWVKEHYRQIELIESAHNLGFAGGNNLAIREALQDGCEAVFLINPDTITDPHCLEELLADWNYQDVRQPLILLHKDGKKTELVNTWGNPLHYLGFSYAGGNGEPAPTATEPHEIMLASGAAVLIPATLFKKSGFFDESFFMYHEDADLSLRFRIHGAIIMNVPKAKVWHKYHFSRNPKKFFYFERNRALTLLKNYQWRTLLLIFPMLVLVELMMVAYSVIGGFFFEKLKAYPATLGLVPHALRERQKVQKLRARSDRELYPLWTGVLRFSEVDNPAVTAFNLLGNAYWRLIKAL